MHVGPKSVLVAHRVTPRTNPAASSRLASRRNPRWASTRTAPGRLPIVTPGSALWVREAVLAGAPPPPPPAGSSPGDPSRPPAVGDGRGRLVPWALSRTKPSL